MKTTHSAGGVVLNNDGLVLVVNQDGRTWSLPKGHVDPGEELVAAAKREVYEESGIKQLRLIKELGSYTRHRIGLDQPDDTSELKTITMFLFETDEMDFNPVDPRHPEARWVDKAAVADLLTHQKDKDFFASVIGELR
ncbi:MAG TPA: NUDIX domain-containing protein [Candidatus Saccharimonadales bacterium]|nr:NUDIX domain-containing protein [Candidatus Saccharimonadales bacterium]